MSSYDHESPQDHLPTGDARSKSPTSKLGGYAELARVSNLPTCVSNALVGYALASGPGSAHWLTAAMIALAVCLLYIFGVVLNDLMDARVDRVERPGRPIPSGRVSQTAAWAVALITLGSGLAILGALGSLSLWLGAVLCLLIVTYNLVHQSQRWGMWVMGAARGMIYVLTAFTVAHPAWPSLATWGLTITLLGYIVVLSDIARIEATETTPQLNRVVAVPVVPLLALVAVRPTEWLWTIVVGGVMVAWLANAARWVYSQPPRVPAAIHGWIAGICLVDAFFLTLLDHPTLAVAATGAWVITAWSHKRIAGT